ncbi:hypothetical protein AB0K00_32060 [Dactylosporangium sp. NPDC049525]|uniref:hypothetical protein n=1 Tax=Dactylosporangium sp. NPDC049525 TaxID=3154730 RepID=UPI00342FF8D0
MTSSSSVAKQPLLIVMMLNMLTMPSYLSIIAAYPAAYSVTAVAAKNTTTASGHNHAADPDVAPARCPGAWTALDQVMTL